MKKSELRQIIKEELKQVMSEQITDKAILDALASLKGLNTTRFDEFEAFAEDLIGINADDAEKAWNKSGVSNRYNSFLEFASNATKEDLNKFKSYLMTK